MGIYQKIQLVRKDLKTMNIKKTGINKFNNYKYFELDDFIPQVMDLFVKYGLCSVFNIDNEKAKLIIIDSENESAQVEYTIPTVYSETTNRNKIQELGATITYLRRYLWIIALELTETDVVDMDNDKTKREEDKTSSNFLETINMINNEKYIPKQETVYNKDYHTIKESEVKTNNMVYTSTNTTKEKLIEKIKKLEQEKELNEDIKTRLKKLYTLYPDRTDEKLLERALATLEKLPDKTEIQKNKKEDNELFLKLMSCIREKKYNDELKAQIDKLMSDYYKDEKTLTTDVMRKWVYILSELPDKTEEDIEKESPRQNNEVKNEQEVVNKVLEPFFESDLTELKMFDDVDYEQEKQKARDLLKSVQNKTPYANEELKTNERKSINENNINKFEDLFLKYGGL